MVPQDCEGEDGGHIHFPGVLNVNQCTKHIQLEIAQSEQDVSPFYKESDMTYS